MTAITIKGTGVTKNEKLDNQAAHIMNLILQGRRQEAVTAVLKFTESMKTKPRKKK